jgi:hypothetical protein
VGFFLRAVDVILAHNDLFLVSLGLILGLGLGMLPMWQPMVAIWTQSGSDMGTFGATDGPKQPQKSAEIWQKDIFFKTSVSAKYLPNFVVTLVGRQGFLTAFGLPKRCDLCLRAQIV